MNPSDCVVCLRLFPGSGYQNNQCQQQCQWPDVDVYKSLPKKYKDMCLLTYQSCVRDISKCFQHSFWSKSVAIRKSNKQKVEDLYCTPRIKTKYNPITQDPLRISNYKGNLNIDQEQLCCCINKKYCVKPNEEFCKQCLEMNTDKQEHIWSATTKQCISIEKVNQNLNFDFAVVKNKGMCTDDDFTQIDQDETQQVSACKACFRENRKKRTSESEKVYFYEGNCTQTMPQNKIYASQIEQCYGTYLTGITQKPELLKKVQKCQYCISRGKQYQGNNLAVDENQKDMDCISKLDIIDESKYLIKNHEQCLKIENFENQLFRKQSVVQGNESSSDPQIEQELIQLGKSNNINPLKVCGNCFMSKRVNAYYNAITNECNYYKDGQTQLEEIHISNQQQCTQTNLNDIGQKRIQETDLDIVKNCKLGISQGKACVNENGKISCKQFSQTPNIPVILDVQKCNEDDINNILFPLTKFCLNCLQTKIKGNYFWKDNNTCYNRNDETKVPYISNVVSNKDVYKKQRQISMIENCYSMQSDYDYRLNKLKERCEWCTLRGFKYQGSIQYKEEKFFDLDCVKPLNPILQDKYLLDDPKQCQKIAEYESNSSIDNLVGNVLGSDIPKTTIDHVHENEEDHVHGEVEHNHEKALHPEEICANCFQNNLKQNYYNGILDGCYNYNIQQVNHESYHIQSPENCTIQIADAIYADGIRKNDNLIIKKCKQKISQGGYCFKNEENNLQCNYSNLILAHAKLLQDVKKCNPEGIQQFLGIKDSNFLGETKTSTQKCQECLNKEIPGDFFYPKTGECLNKQISKVPNMTNQDLRKVWIQNITNCDKQIPDFQKIKEICKHCVSRGYRFQGNTQYIKPEDYDKNCLSVYQIADHHIPELSKLDECDNFLDLFDIVDNSESHTHGDNNTTGDHEQTSDGHHHEKALHPEEICANCFNNTSCKSNYWNGAMDECQCYNEMRTYKNNSIHISQKELCTETNADTIYNQYTVKKTDSDLVRKCKIYTSLGYNCWKNNNNLNCDKTKFDNSLQVVRNIDSCTDQKLDLLMNQKSQSLKMTCYECLIVSLKDYVVKQPYFLLDKQNNYGCYNIITKPNLEEFVEIKEEEIYLNRIRNSINCNVESEKPAITDYNKFALDVTQCLSCTGANKNFLLDDHKCYTNDQLSQKNKSNQELNYYLIKNEKNCLVQQSDALVQQESFVGKCSWCVTRGFKWEGSNKYNDKQIDFDKDCILTGQNKKGTFEINNINKCQNIDHLGKPLPDDDHGHTHSDSSHSHANSNQDHTHESEDEGHHHHHGEPGMLHPEDVCRYCFDNQLQNNYYDGFAKTCLNYKENFEAKYYHFLSKEECTEEKSDLFYDNKHLKISKDLQISEISCRRCLFKGANYIWTAIQTLNNENQKQTFTEEYTCSENIMDFPADYFYIKKISNCNAVNIGEKLQINEYSNREVKSCKECLQKQSSWTMLNHKKVLSNNQIQYIQEYICAPSTQNVFPIDYFRFEGKSDGNTSQCTKENIQNGLNYDYSQIFSDNIEVIENITLHQICNNCLMRKIANPYYNAFTQTCGNYQESKSADEKKYNHIIDITKCTEDYTNYVYYNQEFKLQSPGTESFNVISCKKCLFKGNNYKFYIDSQQALSNCTETEITQQFIRNLQECTELKILDISGTIR